MAHKTIPKLQIPIANINVPLENSLTMTLVFVTGVILGTSKIPQLILTQFVIAAQLGTQQVLLGQEA